jgi:hypothetical protein
MQAITVKFLGPTNSRGSRLKATAQAGSVTLERDHALNVNADYARVALALCNRFGWTGDYCGGFLPNGDCVFVPAVGFTVHA